jgi:RNA polymerase sigma-70 factor, ECF subfamily
MALSRAGRGVVLSLPNSRNLDPTMELLQGCIAGDPDARRRLVEEYRGIVSYGVTVIFKQFGRPCMREEVEDFSHDVFVALFDQDARKLRQYQGLNGCSLASWLRVVANRMTIDRLRKEGRSVSLDDPESAETWRVKESRVDSNPGPEKSAEIAERDRLVREMVEQLPAGDQLFVQLFYYQELPIEEVADTIGISVNAAYVRKMRLHQKLQKLVAGPYQDRLGGERDKR